MTAEVIFTRAGQALAGKHLPQAVSLYQQAEHAGHDADQCAAARWTCHMLAGDFELAWRQSDAIALRGHPNPHRFWDGRSFAGRSVLLRCLHGLGDTLQFVRYAPLIRREARTLTIEAQPKLKPLLEQAGLADRVITWGEPEPPWDQQVEVMELPQIYRTTLHSIPRNVPYIDVAVDPNLEPANIEYQIFKDAPAGALRVGLVWASSHYNPARSIPVECFALLFDTPGVSFLSLQAGSEGSGIEPWARQITVLPEECTSIFDTAKTLKKLDLVITVDTMTAHLAGAMGRPVWTLLPYECDWRWMAARADSPWYPTMRLFRQPQEGVWPPVIDRVRRELLALPAAARQGGRETLLQRDLRWDSRATLVPAT